MFRTAEIVFPIISRAARGRGILFPRLEPTVRGLELLFQYKILECEKHRMIKQVQLCFVSISIIYFILIKGIYYKLPNYGFWHLNGVGFSSIVINISDFVTECLLNNRAILLNKFNCLFSIKSHPLSINRGWALINVIYDFSNKTSDFCLTL